MSQLHAVKTVASKSVLDCIENLHVLFAWPEDTNQRLYCFVYIDCKPFHILYQLGNLMKIV